MQTFLDRSAQHIYSQHPHNQLSKVCIVLPSRRGVLYFKQALARLSDVPFLAPDIFAVDDFVMDITGLRQIDQVALLFELYDVFKEIDPNVVFERFMTWASTLLNDFDKIDQYLVDAKALFAYMSEAKALERWQMQLGESQKDRNLKTDRTDRYFKLFENILTVYQNLRNRLTAQGLVYRGMAYRDLAENVDKYILEKDRHLKYYFVGFNALSDAEERIIRTLLKNKNLCETLWDSDTYFLKNKDQKAGDWLKYYKNGDDKNGITPLFNNEWTWETDELIKGKKNIQIIGVSNASIQAKVAGHIYREWGVKEEGENGEMEEGEKGGREDGESVGSENEQSRQPIADSQKPQTAIVLGDENLLVPVMNSLDESVKDFNITMGLSLRNSQLFTLIDSLFELQRNLVEFKTEEGGTVKIPKFSHRQVVRVLNHPFLRRWELMKYQTSQPHPQPLSDGEGSIRPIFESAPSSIKYGEQNLPVGNSDEKSDEYSPLRRRGVGGEVLEHKFYQKSDYQDWKKIKSFAKENRKNPTKSEEILWNNLRNKQLEGYRVRRQHSINLYIVDFVFLKQNLIIELDGEIHQIDDNPKYDEYRTKELNEAGFRVLRFQNEEVIENHNEVLKTILYFLENENEQPHPEASVAQPLSDGEGGIRPIFESESSEKSDEYSPSPSERGLGGEVINPIRKTLQEITDRNRVFLSSKELAELSNDDPMFTIIFKHWNNNPKNAIKCFYELIDSLRDVYKDSQDSIETEYLYQFYLILQRMEGILEERKDTVTMRSFKTFLYEFIKQTKIPFESETDESLQIMGMLETRTLDFEKVIILSVNEGTLPQGKRQNTLIPFDALTDPQFNLPTHNHADSVMAYHFFRLLQRAKEVVLIHVLPSDTYGAGEKSRFILQIEHELAKMNPNITLTYPTVKFIAGDEEKQEETKLEIQKTEDILQFIENEITEKGIYPSHMNQYLDCSLKYYFSRIAGIAEEDVVEEKMGVDTFGNWIHKTFENIDKEFVENGGVVEKEDLEKVLENIDSYLKQAFKETNMGLRAEEGMNYILYQVGETIVKKFLTYQLKNEIFPLELLDVEKTLKVQFMVDVNNKMLPVKFAGRIDRMDRTGGSHVRVIDYKTGKVEAKDLKINAEDLAETLLTDKDKDKFRQLWLYKYMVLKQMVSSKGLTIRGIKLDETENTVSSGIYSFRNIDEGLLQQNIAFHEGETIHDFLYESEQYLQAFVQDLLNPEKPFEKRKDVENCVYCDYRRICGR
jgi:very-short-patch-repair endonuclease